MSDEHRDPSGNTEAFRAFVQRPEPAPAPRRPPLLVGGAVAVVVAVIVVIVLVLLLG